MMFLRFEISIVSFIFMIAIAFFQSLKIFHYG